MKALASDRSSKKALTLSPSTPRTTSNGPQGSPKPGNPQGTSTVEDLQENYIMFEDVLNQFREQIESGFDPDLIEKQ